MKIATWNVNSVKARLPNVLTWLSDAAPDVVVFQETKTVDVDFPRFEFEALGYHLEIHGQKSYNGVAILSRHPLEDVLIRLPGDDSDEQARYIEATVKGVRVAGLYLPNGNPVPGEKFDYKLRWMKRLHARAQQLIATEQPVVLTGDYNVCPEDIDVYDPVAFAGDALCQPESRSAFRALLNLGYTDALRVTKPQGPAYTYWDYQAGAWAKDNGVRIDHMLLSPQAADRLVTCAVDRRPRAQEKASDHTPVWCELTD
ncbi:exodeoxyribonuclease III [Govanella unica]|uniref:Exodeoxyribonuclease III n=1 Tax=Govanella unica TaxID=2975056 RepID=A0A9X3Z6S0_9PROT|nr:exodeoxyribonuclease III [Govania unica]MDA5193308.1 exodeoxyribonuclease III [Govania unica]